MEKRVICECGHEMAVRPDTTATSLDCPQCGKEIQLPPAEPTPTRTPALEQGHPDRRHCPYCLERVRVGARKCPFCQEYLDPALASRHAAPEGGGGGARTSAMAVTSLLLAVLAPLACFITAPPAVLFGIAGLVATRGRRMNGRSMAIGGLLLGLLWVAVSVGILALMVSAMGSAPGDLLQPKNEYLF